MLSQPMDIQSYIVCHVLRWTNSNGDGDRPSFPKSRQRLYVLMKSRLAIVTGTLKT